MIAAQGPLQRALTKRGVPSQRTEDLVQEASVKALRARARFETGRDMLPWLLLIAWRLELDDRRRQKTPGGVRAHGRGQAGPELDANRGGGAGAVDDVGDVGDAAVLRESKTRVHQAVQDLSEVRRQVVDLFYRDGLGIQQIASRLLVAEGTVKSHLHRAREEIAARLARRDDE